MGEGKEKMEVGKKKMVGVHGGHDVAFLVMGKQKMEVGKEKMVCTAGTTWPFW